MGLDCTLDSASFLSKSFRTKDMQSVVNHSCYSGKTLATASAVPGRLWGHHNEYALLTYDQCVLNSVEHGYSKLTAFISIIMQCDLLTFCRYPNLHRLVIRERPAAGLLHTKQQVRTGRLKL